MTAPTPPPREGATVGNDLVRVLREDGTLDPAQDPRFPEEIVLGLYRQMVSVRRLDERLVVLQREGRIGFHIGSYGEEAAILGAAGALRPTDWIFPSSRELGAALWRGMPIASYVHHMFGNTHDPVKGRQTPDHYTARRERVASISSPTGTQIVHAVGLAWAAKSRQDNIASLVYFGDGATSSEGFHNGMNFAGVFKAPTIFFCRNNGWALGLPVERQTASATLAIKGIAYGVAFVRVDGTDLFAVLKVTRDALVRALAGDGPTLIEAVIPETVRAVPAANALDDAPAQTASLPAQHDPIARVRRFLQHSPSLWSDALQRDLEAKIEGELTEAIREAELAPPPALETMFDDVFANVPPHLEEQRGELLASSRATSPAKGVTRSH